MIQATDIEHQSVPAIAIPNRRRPWAPNRGVTCVLVKNLPDTVYHLGFGKKNRDLTIACALGGINIEDVYFQMDLHYDIIGAHGEFPRVIPLLPNEQYLLLQDFTGDIDSNTASLTFRINTLSCHHQRNRFRISVSIRLIRNDMEVDCVYTNAIASKLKPMLKSRRVLVHQ